MKKSTEPLFIMAVGFIASGKSTLANKLQKDLSLNHIDGDAFRGFIKETVPYYHDLDISYPNPKAKDISNITHIYRRDISQKLLENGQSVIHSGNNLTKETRQSIISQVTSSTPKTKIVFIEVSIEESELIKRLNTRDSDNPGSRWVVPTTLKSRKNNTNRPKKTNAMFYSAIHKTTTQKFTIILIRCSLRNLVYCLSK